MSQKTGRSRVAPEGWSTVVPRIVAQDARALTDFIRQVFGAEGEYRQDRPTDLRIGDSVIMISDAGIRQPTAAFLYVYVRDADATYRRALEAGARSLEDPMDTPYGDRRCMLEDRWGNTWQIATYRGAPPGRAASPAKRSGRRPTKRRPRRAPRARRRSKRRAQG